MRKSTIALDSTYAHIEWCLQQKAVIAHRIRAAQEIRMNVFVQPIDKVGGKDDNEGRSFRNQENQFEFYSATAKFLASHLPKG